MISGTSFEAVVLVLGIEPIRSLSVISPPPKTEKVN